MQDARVRCVSRTSLYVLLSVVLSLTQFRLQKNAKISKLLQDVTKTWHNVRPLNDLPHSGRLRKTTPREYHTLRRASEEIASVHVK